MFSFSNLTDAVASGKTSYFDKVIGALEEVVLDDKFSTAQQDFLDKYCEIFEDSEENKLEYTECFTAYESLGEILLVNGLKERLGDEFDMGRFLKKVKDNYDRLPYDLTDMLESFTDFLAFKQLMLDHKKMRRGD